MSPTGWVCGPEGIPCEGPAGWTIFWVVVGVVIFSGIVARLLTMDWGGGGGGLRHPFDFSNTSGHHVWQCPECNHGVPLLRENFRGAGPYDIEHHALCKTGQEVADGSAAKLLQQNLFGGADRVYWPHEQARDILLDCCIRPTAWVGA